jgi:hypothetical protein
MLWKERFLGLIENSRGRWRVPLQASILLAQAFHL